MTGELAPGFDPRVTPAEPHAHLGFKQIPNDPCVYCGVPKGDHP